MAGESPQLLVQNHRLGEKTLEVRVEICAEGPGAASAKRHRKPTRAASLKNGIPQPIQNMPPHRMPLWHARMIKILPRIPRHPQFLHHPPRPHIPRHRKRNQFRQFQNLKRVSRNRPRAFRGEPAPPIFRRQPPPNLHARRERRLKLRHPNPHKPNKRPIRPQFRRAQTKMKPLEMFLDSIHVLVALLARQQRRHKFHHPRIRVHPRKRRAIRIAPPPQAQPVRIQNHHQSQTQNTKYAYFRAASGNRAPMHLSDALRRPFAAAIAHSPSKPVLSCRR